MKLRLVTFLICWFSCSAAQQKWDIRFYHEMRDREINIFADNREPMPVSAQFDFTLKNLTSTLGNKDIVVIPAGASRFPISTLKPIVNNAANEFSYNNTYNFGNVLLQDYDEDYVYDLPFEKGKSHLIYQGYNGTFSHQGIAALDFNLKTGDKVFAARDGLVVEVVQDNTRSCPNISCAKFNNRIVIMHSDGTFADYAHLKLQGSVVKKGQQVKKGQHIGYSGSTGFSSGPHLHFAVFLNRINGNRQYLKTKFKTAEATDAYLEQGKTYTKQ